MRRTNLWGRRWFRALRRGRGFLIDALAKGDRIELRICRLFLIQIGEPDDILVAQFFRPRDQRSVAAHFVVFDRLRIGHDGGIKNRFLQSRRPSRSPL